MLVLSTLDELLEAQNAVESMREELAEITRLNDLIELATRLRPGDVAQLVAQRDAAVARKNGFRALATKMYERLPE